MIFIWIVHEPLGSGYAAVEAPRRCLSVSAAGGCEEQVWVVVVQDREVGGGGYEMLC